MHTLLWRPLIWVRMMALRSDVQPLGTSTYSLQENTPFLTENNENVLRRRVYPDVSTRRAPEAQQCCSDPAFSPRLWRQPPSPLGNRTDNAFCLLCNEFGDDWSQVPRNWGADWRCKQALHCHRHLPASSPFPSSSVNMPVTNTAGSHLILCRPF